MTAMPCLLPSPSCSFFAAETCAVRSFNKSKLFPSAQVEAKHGQRHSEFGASKYSASQVLMRTGQMRFCQRGAMSLESLTLSLQRIDYSLL